MRYHNDKMETLHNEKFSKHLEIKVIIQNRLRRAGYVAQMGRDEKYIKHFIRKIWKNLEHLHVD